MVFASNSIDSFLSETVSSIRLYTNTKTTKRENHYEKNYCNPVCRYRGGFHRRC